MLPSTRQEKGLGGFDHNGRFYQHSSVKGQWAHHQGYQYTEYLRPAGAGKIEVITVTPWGDVWFFFDAENRKTWQERDNV
jgi:hypothetical protein